MFKKHKNISTIFFTKIETTGMSQAVGPLLCKCETPSSNLSFTTKKKKKQS
jgi:hypothetical protein